MRSILQFVAVWLVCIATATAAGPVQLTTDGRLKRDPIFAEQGQEILFAVQESPVLLQLTRLRLADGSQSPIHPDQTKAEFEPTLSADGRYLAYVQSRGNLSLALVVEDLKERKLAEVPPAGGFAGMSSPAIAPDNSRVLYSFADGGRQQLYSASVLAQDRKVVTDSQGINNWPSFSPDGTQIAFGSTRDGNYDVYVMNADGSNVRKLTDTPVQDIRPRFSPDGRQLAFTSNRDGNYEIYVMRTDGTHVRRVTENSERDDYPAWHPDGRRLVLVSEHSGRHDLFLIDVPD